MCGVYRGAAGAAGGGVAGAVAGSGGGVDGTGIMGWRMPGSLFRGNLAHKKRTPPRNLHYDCSQGPVVDLERGCTL